LPGDPGDGSVGGQADDSEGGLRGWIDPDDRLWRHPSEMAGGGASPPGGPATPIAAASGGHRSRLMILIGAAAVVAAAAWLIILLSPASDRPEGTEGTESTEIASDAPLTTLAVKAPTVPAVAESAGQSMVELAATTSHGTVHLVGVAVAEGGLVATTADALSGLSSISMVGTGGRLLRASVVAIDHGSDLALVNVPDDVPVPTFSDDAAVTDGAADMTLSLASAASTTPALRCLPGTVTAVATSIAGGPAKGMPAISSSPNTTTEESGDPLLNADGDVIGLLYDADPSTGAATTFLPTQLVLGVSDDLRSDTRVVHGWLGLSGTDAPANGSGTAGAEVAAVKSDGPASGRLHVGDEIIGVDDSPVRTMAELRGRLYVLAPGTTVQLSVLSGNVTRVVDVTLTSSS
jgi:S1-C subfamily serine protease